MICPLEKINDGWGGYKNVFVKRLDLFGGNKVFRFEQFFKKNKDIETLVAFSNPGAHTFHVLGGPPPNSFPKGRGISLNNMSGNMKLLFLEQEMPTNSYTEARRNLYLNKENTKVIQAPFWQQMIRFLYYKYFGGKKYTTLGIGGHIDLKDANPYKEIAYPLEPSKYEGEEKQVYHLFPIASGNMADCLISFISKKENINHHLIGITTGGKRTFSFLNFKYRNNKKISLYRPLEYSYESYKEKARLFYEKANFWLDPTHTIHLLDIMDQELLPKDAVIVMWITCPLVEKLYE
jgi:hypothetical protein